MRVSVSEGLAAELLDNRERGNIRVLWRPAELGKPGV